MKYVVFFVAPLAASGPAVAQDIASKPLVDARLRYEGVDQDGIDRKAEAVTARVRAGIEATTGLWSLLAETEATLAIDDRYNSGVNGKTVFPVVADPQNVEINRIQLQYRGLPRTLVTIGRQRINLDDQRFVGSVGWRDNEQTFDSARIEWSGIEGLNADITYAWSARTIYGVDGGKFNNPNRPQSIAGDNVFANLAWTTGYGTLTGFAYLIDQDEPVAALRRNSSQTYGMRFADSRPLSKSLTLIYVASYARQSNWRGSPVRYSADYWLGELGVESRGTKLTGGYEILGTDDGSDFSFQAPFGALHKFQGWADKFLTTPNAGIRDLYAAASHTRRAFGPFSSINLQAVYHRFDSDRGNTHYGNEMDLLVAGKFSKRFTASAKYADFSAHSLSAFRDTRKLWVSLEWAY